jgi:superfamily II DNA or RNA helicase
MNEIIPHARALFFLAGYFYFSGFEQLYKSIGDKPLKILVGLEVEKDLNNRVKEFTVLEKTNKAKDTIRKNYYQSLVTLFNDTDYFDTQAKQDAFRLFVEKIKGGSLEIRKTLDSNHAKLYLFEAGDDHRMNSAYQGTVITGSSNLTASGLSARQEVNVIFYDDHYEEAKKIFTDLWQTAVILVDKNNINLFIQNVYDNIWVGKYLEHPPRPYDLYMRVIQEFFALKNDSPIKKPSDITSGTFLDLKYQEDAVRNALNILNIHDGVIIADVVGLGKSIIASTIANNLNKKTIIICPPHLHVQWEEYRTDFNFNAKVFSSGSIDKAFDWSKRTNKEDYLIIVDEAHRYRNEYTQDYLNLHKLCLGNKVILLTATPFNNEPQDIFSMIKLFQIPTRSTMQAVNLSGQFRDLIREYGKLKEKNKRNKDNDRAKLKQEINSISARIRDILFPLIIRRTRIDLEKIKSYKADLDKQGISFAEVIPPDLKTYELGGIENVYLKTLEKIAPENEDNGFIGARYKPTSYLINREKYKKELAEEYGDDNMFVQAQKNLAKFMKRLLVRRFESSIYAFSSTLDSMIKSAENIKSWHDKLSRIPVAKKGGFPSADDYADLEDAEIDDLLKKLQEGKDTWFINKKELKGTFYTDLLTDIKLLEGIKEDWKTITYNMDPKIAELKKYIKEKMLESPGRKIVIFSEFADTVWHIYSQLKNDFKIFKYDSSDSSVVNKQIIRDNFDAGLPTDKQKNDYEILAATDAISEGFNLHRAGIIINYDIPYNPTRVIQRVGRINRINKKVFDQLHIVNFFPTLIGNKVIAVKRISTLKKDMINALIGDDTKVLTDEEELRSFFVDQYKEAEARQENEESWDSKYRDLLSELNCHHQDLLQKALDMPKRVRARRSVLKDRSGVLVFGKKGKDYVFKFGNNDSEQVLLAKDALALFEAEITESPKKVSDAFEEIYQRIKKNLFTKKTAVERDRGLIEAEQKISALKIKMPEHQDYFADIQRVIELDALVGWLARRIRTINENNLAADMQELLTAAPPAYLAEIIEKANNIENSEETLILSEELI